jgi:phosphate/sulfate permease
VGAVGLLIMVLGLRQPSKLLMTLGAALLAAALPLGVHAWKVAVPSDDTKYWIGGSVGVAVTLFVLFTYTLYRFR